MYRITDAHFITVVIVAGTFMIPPFYMLGLYVFSGASPRKGMRIGTAFLIWGAFMFWLCLSDTTRKLGPLGNLVVPVVWIAPTLILLSAKNWFLDRKLSQQWLIGLQVFRCIGGLFLLEMATGNIPGIFAYPAGFGDILVSLVALGVLIGYGKSARIPKAALFLVFGLGVADFLSAFFFGIFSSEGPQQLFYPAVANNVVLFPTGMIPLYLVPYAIFFHFLSILNYSKFER